MSRASAWVRFPDGTVRYGLYDGTVDMMFPRLFNSNEEAWDMYSPPDGSSPEQGALYRDDAPGAEVEDVLIYTDYGWGWAWPARATRWYVHGGLEPWDEHDQDARWTFEGENEEPEWAVYKMDSTTDPSGR